MSILPGSQLVLKPKFIISLRSDTIPHLGCQCDESRLYFLYKCFLLSIMHADSCMRCSGLISSLPQK